MIEIVKMSNSEMGEEAKAVRAMLEHRISEMNQEIMAVSLNKTSLSEKLNPNMQYYEYKKTEARIAKMDESIERLGQKISAYHAVIDDIDSMYKEAEKS